MIIDLSEVACALPLRFYSNNVPRSIKWPFLLVHVENIDLLGRSTFSHAILDIHVHRFRKMGDYPISELVRYGRLVEKLAEKYRDRICIVLPDLPYDVEYFHGVQYPQNVKKTYTYHTMFIRYVDRICQRYGSQMMLVVQHRQSLRDVEYSCHILTDLLSWTCEEHVYAIGVGSLCVNKSPRQVAKYLNTVARFFPNYRIHGFGVKVSTIRYVNFRLDRLSIDGTGWTRTPNRLGEYLTGKRHSAYSEKERTIYFICGILNIVRNIGNRQLIEDLLKLLEKVTGRKIPRELAQRYI